MNEIMNKNLHLNEYQHYLNYIYILLINHLIRLMLIVEHHLIILCMLDVRLMMPIYLKFLSIIFYEIFFPHHLLTYGNELFVLTVYNPCL